MTRKTNHEEHDTHTLKMRKTIENENQVWLREQYLTLPEISQLVIARVVRKLNEERTTEELIRLSQWLTKRDEHELQMALRKLWWTEDILSGWDTLGLRVLQDKMRQILTYAPEHPESIESLMEEDDFAAIAGYNLKWLVERHFDKTCEQPQLLLDRIIAYINSTRIDTRTLDLSENYLWLTDQQALLNILELLGGTDLILRDNESKEWRAFRMRMDHALGYPPDHIESIEGILNQIDSPILQYLREVDKKTLEKDTNEL